MGVISLFFSSTGGDSSAYFCYGDEVFRVFLSLGRFFGHNFYLIFDTGRGVIIFHDRVPMFGKKVFV